MDPDLEIVGLYSDTNERSCVLHETCGMTVKQGDVLRLVQSVVEINGVVEPAVKCVKVVNGIDACTVAFVPRIYQKQPKVQDHLNKFVTVLELYADSNNTYKRNLSTSNFGMAAVVFLQEDQGRNE